MTEYQIGFAAGERAAFEDRRQGVQLPQPAVLVSKYQQGFWAAYMPRNQSWSMHVVESSDDLQKSLQGVYA